MVAAANLIAIALALHALRRARPEAWAIGFIVSLFLLWNLIYLPFVTSVRYAFPFYALLFVFSGAGLAELVSPTRQRGHAYALEQ